MLHRIELPDCEADLRWIVGLQRKLLESACQPEVTGADVDYDWVLAQLQTPGLDEKWIQRLVSRRDRIQNSGRPVIEHLRYIADLAPELKSQLMDEFDNDHKFLDEYSEGGSRHLIGTTKLESSGSVGIILALRGLLESFYAPGFYESHGYLIPRKDGRLTAFHRTEYLKEYLAKNPDVQVCPYCDGDLSPAEIDHFLPKSKYPQLSCHPLNLVPVCGGCNTRENKGEKVPLEIDAEDQMAAWFHPFLRTAKDSFEVQFVQDGHRTQPILTGLDPVSQVRLDHLTELVNLKKRWQVSLARIFRATQRKLDRHFGGVSTTVSEEQVSNKLSEWAFAAESEFGLIPFAILEHAHLASAAHQETAVFRELWTSVSHADPVTGA